MTREHYLCALFTHTANLGCDELRALAFMAERAEMGRRQYGDLNLATDKRCFPVEYSQEQCDESFYRLCETLRMIDGRMAR